MYEFVKFYHPALCCPNFLFSKIPNLWKDGKNNNTDSVIINICHIYLYTFSSLGTVG